MRALLAIDPGMHSMGWALWMHPVSRVPDRIGLVGSAYTGIPWQEVIKRQIDALHGNEHICGLDYDKLSVVCEMPQFFTTKSVAGIIHLSFMVGQLLGEFRTHGADVEAVDVLKWKGQLPKTVVMHRVKQFLGVKNCTYFQKDTWDAVGLGLYKLGYKI